MTSSLSFDTCIQANPCQPQAFSIPSNIIHYISKNPSSSKFYQKLIQTCKYFYLKQRFIVINKLESSQIPNIWKAYEKPKGKEFITLNARSIQSNLWLIGELNVCNYIPVGSVNLLLQKVKKCDITSLYLNNYKISFNEFLVLTSSMKITHLALEDIIVRDGDDDGNGKIVPFEDILERVPNVSYFAYSVEENVNLVYTSQTAAKMAKLPPFPNLKHLHILQNSDEFNPNDFCDFVKKNSSAVDYLITFHDSISMEHKRWFKYTIDKMLHSWEAEEKPSISVSLLF